MVLTALSAIRNCRVPEVRFRALLSTNGAERFGLGESVESSKSTLAEWHGYALFGAELQIPKRLTFNLVLTKGAAELFELARV